MIGLHVEKRILFLLIIFAFAVAYSIVSLDTTADSIRSENDVLNAPELAYKNSSVDTAKKAVSNIASVLQTDPKRNADPKINELPFKFLLVGVSDLQLNQEPALKTDIKVLVQFENELYEHQLNDFLFNTDMQLVRISPEQISILFEKDLYKKSLTPPNLLSAEFKDQEKPFSELIQMTAKEISSRPRIIEHLVYLTATPYIADGKIVSPGLNPALFEQAGFKVDDVLKTINGKSVTVESEFDAIKKQLKTAQTLTFLVMRKGRLVTLYLDIPSETLELIRD